MLDAAVLSKHMNRADYPEGFNREDIFPPAGRGIEDMTVAASMKKKNNPSQKYDGGDPSGGIVPMAVSMV